MIEPLSVERARRAGATPLQVAVVEMRNADSSWRVIARALGVSVRTVREAWGVVNREQRGDLPAGRATRVREDATIGNEQLLRGIPVSGFGGAIRGTRPGDPVPAPEQATQARSPGVLVVDPVTARGLAADLPAAGRLRKIRGDVTSRAKNGPPC